MIEKVRVLLEDGSRITLPEWQRAYGLTVNSHKIGQYFSLGEPRFRADLERFGKLIVCAPLMRVLDRFRYEVDRPVHINSFNRTKAYQRELKNQGYRTATYSPHVEKMAADIDTTSHAQTNAEVQVLRNISADMGIPIRIGWLSYQKRGQTFIHVDVCPHYFGAGGPLAQRVSPPVPDAWRIAGAEW